MPEKKQTATPAAATIDAIETYQHHNLDFQAELKYTYIRNHVRIYLCICIYPKGKARRWGAGIHSAHGMRDPGPPRRKPAAHHSPFPRRHRKKKKQNTQPPMLKWGFAIETKSLKYKHRTRLRYGLLGSGATRDAPWKRQNKHRAQALPHFKLQEHQPPLWCTINEA